MALFSSLNLERMLTYQKPFKMRNCYLLLRIKLLFNAKVAEKLLNGISKICIPDLNPQDPQDSLQWYAINSGFVPQAPDLDHSGHFAYSSKHPWNESYFSSNQRYRYKVLQTFQMKLILLCVWAFLWKHQCFCFHYWVYLTNIWHNSCLIHYLQSKRTWLLVPLRFLPLCHIFYMSRDKQLSWKYNLDGQFYNYLGHCCANLHISKSYLRKDMANLFF